MIERQKRILETLASRENATVGELSHQLNVSEVTIRTDLNQLAHNGKIIRHHGGARLAEERLRQEHTFQSRSSLNADKKSKIGALAASLINSMESVLLDSSTTSVAIARSLRSRDELKDVTVVPTGIWTAMDLMGCPNVNVLMAGGYLRETSGSIVGLPANEFLTHFNLHKAFLGAWGISVQDGFSDAHLLEVELKRFIVQRAKEVIIVADGSKFSQSGLAAYAGINQVSKIITDESAPEQAREELRAQGVEVLIAR